ncbi:MAG: hypothetical protein KBA86_08905 [Bacteroidales bacterium]|nr:hypothetical protein [Bacteroidales bacterium]
MVLVSNGHIHEMIVFLDCLCNCGIITISGFPWDRLLLVLLPIRSILEDYMVSNIQVFIILSAIPAQAISCSILDNIPEHIRVFLPDL